MAGLLLRGRTWFGRLNIPEDRWNDVGRALGAKSGVKREVVRTLETPSKREALRRLPAAEALWRAEIDSALMAAKLQPLTDWTSKWHEKAAAIREDLDTRGLAIAYHEYEHDGSATPVYQGEGIIDAAREAAEVVRRRQGAAAAERFLTAATSEGLTIGQASRQWLEDEARRVRATTIVSHKGALEKLARFLNDAQGVPSLEVAEFPVVTRRLAGEFMQMRRTESAGPTVLREFSAYSGLWKWAIRRGHIEANPWNDQTAGLKALRDDEDGARKRAFTTAEVVTLLRAGQHELAPNRGALAPTFWDAIRLALLTGTRASELVDMAVGGGH